MTTFLRLTIFGLVTGGIYAVAATGLVVTYTTSGIFNFAHGAIGMLAAFLYWELHVNHGIPTLVSLALVLLVFAPLAGALLERTLIRPLHGAPFATTIVVTVGILAGCLGLAQQIWKPGAPRVVEEFFPAEGFHVAGVFVSWHRAITLLIAAATVVALRHLLHHSRAGTTMRAVVDDRDLTSLSGVAPTRPSALSWAIGSSLAALAGILIAPLITLDVVLLTLLVIDAYAAAVVGRLRSLPLTFLGAMILGLAQSHGSYWLPKAFPGDRFPDWLPGFTDSLPVILLFVALLALPEARLRGARAVRAVTGRVPSVRHAAAGALLLTGVAWAGAGFMTGQDVQRVGEGVALGLIGLSLVPLTGFAGQVSLCPFAFAGLGAVAMSKVGGGGSWVGLLVAMAVPAAVGALVALPALRLQGLYLALSTLAFAVLVDYMVFPQASLFRTSITLERPDLFGLSLQSDRAWFVVLAAAYGLAAVFVVWLRRGRLGRRLVAMRDSPVGCAMTGMSLTRTKLVVFALSAAMAGLGGAMLAAMKVSISAKSFTALGGLTVLLIAVIGGIETASGPLLGGLALAGMTILAQEAPALGWVPAVGPAVAAIVLARQRDGVAAVLGGLARNVVGRRRGRAPTTPDPLTALDGSWPVGQALEPARVRALDGLFGIDDGLCTAESAR
ncbi:MAG: ABC transporter permease [Acidimicrobiia bacterium]|nr:ABC transporter permease [Acidimicrobiia bacterium]